MPFEGMWSTIIIVPFPPSMHTDRLLISSGWCICEKDIDSFNCSLPLPHISVYLGELFQVTAVLVGDMHGLVQYEMWANINSDIPTVPSNISAMLCDSQNTQTSSVSCTSLNFSILTNVSN